MPPSRIAALVGLLGATGCLGRNLIEERASAATDPVSGGDPGGGDDPGDLAPTDQDGADPAPALRLLRALGPQTVLTRTCVGPFRFESQDLTGAPQPVGSDVTLTLTPLVEATWHGDANCSGAEAEAIIPAGQSGVARWLWAKPPGPLTLEGQAAGHLAIPLPVLVSEPHWRNVMTANAPEPRLAAAGVYHPTRGTVILYGGCEWNSGTAYRNMWEYDGTDWTELCATCAPGLLLYATMTYDPSQDRLLLFGGTDDCNDPPATASGALWQWTAAGGWTSLSNSGAPSARFGAASAWDERRSRWVIFGGATSSGTVLADLYEWSASGWTEPLQPATRPAARALHAATFAPTLGETLVYGGMPGDMDDLWQWNGSRWSQICTTCSGFGRDSAMLGYYQPQLAVYLVMGFAGGGAGELPGSWWFTGSDFELLLTSPPTRDTSVMVYDPLRERIVLFGGNGPGCGGGGDCDDTWELGYP